jgi:hypothetical protein
MVVLWKLLPRHGSGIDGGSNGVSLSKQSKQFKTSLLAFFATLCLNASREKERMLAWSKKQMKS